MSNSSSNQSTSAVKGGHGMVATPANSGAGLFGTGSTGAAHKTPDDQAMHTKRASQDGAATFGNLSSLKRGSGSEADTARRGSLHDQKPEPGMLGKMWNNFTKGS